MLHNLYIREVVRDIKKCKKATQQGVAKKKN